MMKEHERNKVAESRVRLTGHDGKIEINRDLHPTLCLGLEIWFYSVLTIY